MPIGIIIMAVLGIAAFIAAKCCGVKIDPIGRIKKFSNDLRDRWRWLDKMLNKIPKFRRNVPEHRREATLYVDLVDDDHDLEPYYQPVGTIRTRTSTKVSIDSISIMTRTSNVSGTTGISNAGYGKMENESEDESLSDQFEEMPKMPRMRPKSLALNLKPRILTTDTVTPISLLDSSFTGHANSLLGTPNISATDQTSFFNFDNETNVDGKRARTRTVSNRQSIKSGQTTPIMIEKTPIYLNEIKGMKGTDFKRC